MANILHVLSFTCGYPLSQSMPIQSSSAAQLAMDICKISTSLTVQFDGGQLKSHRKKCSLFTIQMVLIFKTCMPVYIVWPITTYVLTFDLFRERCDIT